MCSLPVSDHNTLHLDHAVPIQLCSGSIELAGLHRSMARSGTTRRGSPAVAALQVVLVVVMLAVAMAPGGARAALSCSTVYNTLMPCLGYVQSGGTVPRACCTGIKRLVSGARSTQDRRTVCVCLKNVSSGAKGGPYLTRAAGLPARCGVPLPYKTGPNDSCSSIH
ncbi:non-specific lipid-transfer protein P5 [Brachypodium distachyon]|uniref:Non-specific lipid-transfer protein n=1 Tax=Brachypodium distachyon TaxID=15368 RepID=A0A2K2D9V4_BRADI|nr:non-specific lipid-transfer protein P5 [Brachypodium distachyon]PNT71056.1 hypothetical protein BRADI_2g22284v3 [Brachypodium distachyon]|eukprot:XP_003566138.2 non-specific lipid-transfer protein P5 [Brachypodium distachyon]